VSLAPGITLEDVALATKANGIELLKADSRSGVVGKRVTLDTVIVMATNIAAIEVVDIILSSGVKQWTLIQG
jgi:hypothetical protein